MGFLENLVFSKLLMLLLVFVLLRVTKGDGSGTLAGWYWCLLFLCPLLSNTTLLQLSNNLFFRSYPQLFPVIPSLLLAINLLIYVLNDRIMHAQSERSKRLLLEQQNIYYLNQYHMIQSLQEDSFKFQHDFKHILLGLRVKLDSGEPDATAQELDTLFGRLEPDAYSCNTENLVVDSILNYKIQNAAHHELTIPPQLTLDTAALCVILGNALDNAIEACQGITEPEPERQITVHMHYLNDSLFVRIRTRMPIPFRPVLSAISVRRRPITDHMASASKISKKP
ncbi:GHKL domain-containing protein [Paenibacillus sp. FSL L8-0470]|uniref:GHKL domain-containing protein n=1 Tax=Paenibacillus sp. FSL L8-0470 TaxID=2954688 RepID=UPI0030FA43B3